MNRHHPALKAQTKSTPRSRRPHFGDDVLGNIGNAITHPDQIVGDIGKVASDAVSTAGNIVTHPSDDFNFALSTATHPEDTFNASMNFVSPDVAKMMKDSITFMRDSFTDFAKSDVGKELLTVAASAAYMGSAFALGPVMLLVFSVPGLLRGDDFTHAWLDGMFTQASRAAKALSGGNVDINVLPPDIQAKILSYTTKLTDDTGIVAKYLQEVPTEVQDFAYDKLATQLNVGEDAAMLALANAKDSLADLDFFNQCTFDPITHKLLTRPKLPADGTTSVQNAAIVNRFTPTMLRAIDQGQALAAHDKVYTAARSLADQNINPAMYRQGFDIGLGLAVQSTTPSGIHGATSGIKSLPGFGTGKASVVVPPHILAVTGIKGVPPSAAPAAAAKMGVATGTTASGQVAAAPRVLAAGPILDAVELAKQNDAIMQSARAMLSPASGQRGYDAAVALFRGRAKAGATASYNGTVPGAAGYFTTLGMVDGGDSSAAVNVMQGVASDPAAKAGAATAIAQTPAHKSWWQTVLSWIGL